MIIRAFTQLALVALLAACGTDPPESSSGSVLPDTGLARSTPDGRPFQPDDPELNSQLLTPDGWGPLRIGMDRAAVVAAAGEDANPEAVGGSDPDECDEFRPSRAPDGVLVMLERGVLTRISVSRNTDIATPAGFRVGDAGTSVLAEYGARASVDPHKYQEPPARYITVWRQTSSETEQRGIRYETDSDDNVLRLHAGGPSIEYVEGCL